MRGELPQVSQFVRGDVDQCFRPAGYHVALSLVLLVLVWFDFCGECFADSQDHEWALGRVEVRSSVVRHSCQLTAALSTLDIEAGDS